MRRLALVTLSVALFPSLLLAQPSERENDSLPKEALVRIGSNRFYGSGHRMKFSLDGKILAIADHERLRLVDAASGRERLVLTHLRPADFKAAPPIPSTVVEFVFSADGKAILSCDEAGGLHLWKVSDGAETRWPGLHPGIASLCLAADEKSVFTAGFDGVLRQWGFPKIQAIKTWSAPDMDPVLAVAVLGMQVAGVTKGGILFHWDPVSGKDTKRIDIGQVLLGISPDFAARKFPAKGSTFPSFAVHPRNVEFSPDGKRLAQHQGQQIWDVETGKVLANLPPASVPIRFAFTQDGQTVVAAPFGFKQPLRLFKSASGDEIRKLDAGRISAVALSPDAETVAFIVENSVRLWKHARNELIGGDAAIGNIRDWDATANGTQVAVATKEKQVRLYDLKTGKHQESFSTGALSPELVRYHSDGRKLILAFQGEGIVHYEKNAGAWQAGQKFPLQVPIKEMTGPGKLLPNGLSITSLIDLETGKFQAGLAQKTVYHAFNYSPDGTRVLVGAEVPPKPPAKTLGNMRREYQIFQLKPLTLLNTFPAPPAAFASWRFSPDGRLGVFGGAKVRIVEVLSGTDRAVITMPFPPTSLEFSPDGRLLIVGTHKGEVIVYRLPKGEEVYRADNVHQGSVRELRNTRDRQVISVGNDQTMVVWSRQLWSERAAGPALKLDAEDLELFYNLLEDKTGVNVASTVASMTAGGDATVAFLKTKLKPAAQADPASRPPTAPRLREHRALEVLEQIGTPAARALLDQLARGHADAATTIEAKESLARLSAP